MTFPKYFGIFTMIYIVRSFSYILQIIYEIFKARKEDKHLKII